MGMSITNIDKITEENPLLGEALQSLADAHDAMGQKLSVNPQGVSQPPPPHVSLTVTAANGVCHVVADHGNNPKTRNLEHFIEYQNTGNWKDAQVEHLGVGNQRRIPTFLNSKVYFRSYSMYRDSTQRSDFSYATVDHDGTPTFTTGVALAHPGSAVLTSTTASLTGPPLPPSKGSGTSPTPGQGFGQERFVSAATTPGKPPSVFSK